MPLQNLTKQRIEDSFGLKSIIHAIDQTALRSSVNDAFYLNNLIIYLRSLHSVKVDVVQDLIIYKEQAEHTLLILRRKSLGNKSEQLILMADILEDNINYTSNIRRIG